MASSLDLDVEILQFLKESDKETRFTEIIEALRIRHQIPEDDFDAKNNLRVKVYGRLQSLVKHKIVSRCYISHKNVCYGIKDHAHVAYILSAYAQGLRIIEKPTPYKTEVTLSAKDFETLANELAKILLNIAFAARPVLQPFAPLTIRCGEPLKDKLLMILPDEASAQKLREFSKGGFEDLTKFLTMAFGMFIQGPGRTSFKDTVIIKFTQKQLEKLEKEGKRLDKTVYEAALALAHQGFLLPRVENLPATAEAIRKGKFVDQQDAYRKYILQGERAMAERLLFGEE